MKIFHGSLFLAAGFALMLPAPQIHSQVAAPPADPLAAIQALQTANDDLIKRQESTLKDLTDMTDSAREIRIFSKRG